ncbi:MAG TPA: hypothetical protein VJ806_16825 [Luteimonas sp.]|nr:hypothetical protein [Luteimonas sp.]
MRFALTLWTSMVLLLPAVSHACINAVGTDHRGKRFEPAFHVGEDLEKAMTAKRSESYWVTHTRQIAGKARKEPDFKNLTDLAITLIYRERYAPAIELLLTIEKRYPGHHETAANLGTALELAGYDQVALRWIRIGIQRNSEEHWGTEWLHARILEAKLAAASNPGYLDNHSVAGLKFGAQLVPPMPAMPPGNDGKPVKPWQLNRAFDYQLSERLQFVRAPDPVVANLLMDWATLNLAGGPVESADALYGLAMRYGAERTPLTVSRRSYIREVLARTGDKLPEGYGCDICQPLNDDGS